MCGGSLDCLALGIVTIALCGYAKKSRVKKVIKVKLPLTDLDFERRPGWSGVLVTGELVTIVGQCAAQDCPQIADQKEGGE